MRAVALFFTTLQVSAADQILKHLNEWSPDPSGTITTPETAKEIAIAVWISLARRGFGVELKRETLGENIYSAAGR
jgi:hypothetical protein